MIKLSSEYYSVNTLLQDMNFFASCLDRKYILRGNGNLIFIIGSQMLNKNKLIFFCKKYLVSPYVVSKVTILYAIYPFDPII